MTFQIKWFGGCRLDLTYMHVHIIILRSRRGEMVDEVLKATRETAWMLPMQGVCNCFLSVTVCVCMCVG